MIFRVLVLFAVAAAGCAEAATSGADGATGVTQDATDETAGDAQTDGAMGGADGLAKCRPYSAGAALGALKGDKLGEISGLADSRRNSGVLWIHNDSGDKARIFAVNLAGTLLSEVTVPGASAVDWEDIAVGPGPQAAKSYLYIGDIGDNQALRKTIFVYRAPEPLIDPGLPGAAQNLADVETLELVYPDGAHDAESLLVDPWNGDLFVLTKAADGKSKLYLAKAPLQPGSPLGLVKVAKLEFGKGVLPGDELATAGDISADGLSLGLRSRDTAFEWRRLPGESVAMTLLAAPCVIPLALEDQGEAFGYAADGTGIHTVGEGKGAKMLFYKLK